MSYQCIMDSNGQTTGVYIPINEWNKIKSQIENLEIEEDSVPEWHKEIVNERMEAYKKGEQISQDFNAAMDEIDRDILCIPFEYLR